MSYAEASVSCLGPAFFLKLYMCRKNNDLAEKPATDATAATF
jgi:hypothetical protein